MSEKEPPAAYPTAEIEEVIEQILLGYTRQDVIEALEKVECADPGSVYVAALAHIETRMQCEGQPLRAWHLAARQLLYRKNMEISDFKSAHHVLKDMAEISGVYKRAGRAANLEALKQLTVDS